MLRKLIVNLLITIPLTLILFTASLHIISTKPGIRQVGSPVSECAVCGTYKVEIKSEGWPLTAIENVYGQNGIVYPEAARQLQPLGTLADLGFWLAVAEIIVTGTTYLTRKLN